MKKKFYTLDNEFMPFGIPELEATSLEDLRAEGLTFKPEVEEDRLDMQDVIEPLEFE